MEQSFDLHIPLLGEIAVALGHGRFWHRPPVHGRAPLRLLAEGQRTKTERPSDDAPDPKEKSGNVVTPLQVGARNLSYSALGTT
jgi:hypothetical protein